MDQEGSNAGEVTVLLLAVLLVAVIAVPLLGGRLGALAELELSWLWAIPVAVGIQIFIISIIPGRFTGTHAPLHVLSYLFAAAFLIRNARLPGVWLIGSGTALNLLAIVANGGVMPAGRAALEAAGVVQDAGQFANSTALPAAKLLFLGDIFYVPDSVPLLDTVFSIGDVAIGLGAIVLIHSVSGSRLLARRSATSNAPDAEVAT